MEVVEWQYTLADMAARQIVQVSITIKKFISLKIKN